jgi:hypothetical protein
MQSTRNHSLFDRKLNKKLNILIYGIFDHLVIIDKLI